MTLTLEAGTGMSDGAELWKRFGDWYQSERKARRISQEDAATRAGITRPHLSEIENGKTGAKRQTVLDLARAIEIDEREALNRAGFAQVVHFQTPIDFPDSVADLLDSLPPSVHKVRVVQGEQQTVLRRGEPSEPATKEDVEDLKRQMQQLMKMLEQAGIKRTEADEQE